MKKALIILIASVCVVIGLFFASRAVNSYLKEEEEKFARAVLLIQRNAYLSMLSAQDSRDIKRLAYYRYIYLNAAKIVADLGPDNILLNEKRR